MCLPDYKELVHRLMTAALQNGAEGVPFKNLGTDHAKIVIEEMITNANSTIDIFATKLCAEVFDHKQFRDFCRRVPNGKIRIITEEADAITNQASALYFMSDLVDRRIQWKVRSPGPQKQKVTIVDSRHARVETYAIARSAQVVFGPNALVESAKKLFDSLWDNGSTAQALNVEFHSSKYWACR
jgi:hypothetical protein